MNKTAQTLTALFSAILCALVSLPAAAQVVSVQTWVEQWDPAAQKWVRVSNSADRFVPAPALTPALTPAPTLAPASATVTAQYGPFQVNNEREASLVGVTNFRSPQDFAAMLRDHPNIAVLHLVDCPGTEDDRGNFAVGRMIRNAGIETHVPKGGSVRSGAVELFLAGKTKRIDDGAQFAVHSWLDNYGREAHDFAPNAPQNRLYLDYYREMGMDEGLARAFYDMTNSVPHASAKWLSAQDMRGWVGQTNTPSFQAPAQLAAPIYPATPPAAKQGQFAARGAASSAAPKIAYLDLPTALN